MLRVAAGEPCCRGAAGRCCRGGGRRGARGGERRGGRGAAVGGGAAGGDVLPGSCCRWRGGRRGGAAGEREAGRCSGGERAGNGGGGSRETEEWRRRGEEKEENASDRAVRRHSMRDLCRVLHDKTHGKPWKLGFPRTCSLPCASTRLCAENVHFAVC
jgi:hypothetical protein